MNSLDPYRDSLVALMGRRDNLLRELEQLDLDIRQRAILVIPCFSGLSRWKLRKVKKAWATIRKLGYWSEERCPMYHMEPCERPQTPCGVAPSQEQQILSRHRAVASRGGSVALPQPPPGQEHW